MKKKFSIIFLLSLLLLIFLGSYSLLSVSPSQNYPNNITLSSPENIVIYVNSTIYSDILDSINQYKSDIEADGYNVSVYNWSDLAPDRIIRANNLKSNLTLEYNLNNIIGAVLIGQLPYAEYENLSDPYDHIPYCGYNFACDLFLMDLDGNWTDHNGDNFYDDHQPTSTGDLYPEIFIGRIDPYSINHPNQTQALIDYFNRNHLYRTGSLPRYNNSVMYIDNPWESTSEEWKGDMEYLYDDITLINSSYEITDAQNYIDALQQNYEFIWSFIHSNHTHHGFDWTPSSGTFVNYSQIANLNTKALFYNLYCCYAAKFDAMDNLATHYLFSSNYTLAVFGCARSGGFVMNRYLYNPLSNGKTLGESFKLWWSNDQYHSHGHGPDDMNQKGNCLLGDPLLKIREPSENSGPSGQPNFLHLLIALCIIFGIITVVVIISFKMSS
ncbi:MAG: hypothetical protein GF329_00625 [Candidatus Lokiarchaeota archaeon]|nr:hypothetical protein [Candidatus Lokiarchaeota archaeon]